MFVCQHPSLLVIVWHHRPKADLSERPGRRGSGMFQSRKGRQALCVSYNHSSQRQTLTYLGIQPSEIREAHLREI